MQRLNMVRSILFLGSFLMASLEVIAQIPWIMPWDDAEPSITDVSAYNHPITTNRVAVDTNGHFVVNGERVRFLGVNFAGDSPFMPTNNAPGVAARLAKLGVNSVRFHHMDASWAYNGGLLNYTSTTSTNFRAANLERLHYLVTRLKARGIYANINLLVGRSYRSGDGLGPDVVGMDWKDSHILGYFFPPALALHKDYASKLLTPTNKFSGLSLAQDPAVAFVEIINENGIIQKWYDGGLDRLPPAYAPHLKARWNQWLVARYADEAAMLAAWGVINEPPGTNMLRNGTFTNAYAYWNREQHSVAKASFTTALDFTNSGICARVEVTNTSPTSWHIQLNQPNLQLVSTQVYTVSYWAKCSVPTNIEANVMRAHTDYVNLGYLRTLSLTTNWQRFTNTFLPSASETNARMGFSGMGDKLAAFYFADVRLQTGGSLGNLPAGTSLEARSIPLIAYSDSSGFAGTRAARRDWLRFLRELENAYYDEMIHFVRSNCGYKGLIFGTIMANSPASVQSRMDVVDAHAYWKHPDFPGNPWDSVNWTVENVSMVNSLDNTLTSMGRQRIKGKPFTVTEYQHPSPNYYGAEGVLMLAAYAGLQDWDGLWMFDYGYGGPVSGVNMGYVRGFFEMGQHPTKMANLPLAANLFRRGDIAPAQQEFSVAMSDEKELDLLLNGSAWSVFSSSRLGMPGKRALANRVNTALIEGASTTPPADIPGNDITSDTGELRWNLSQPGKGLLTYNTRRSKGLIGYCDNKSVDLGGITLRPGTTRLGWSTLGLSLVRGNVLTNDCTALIVASGWWENTGQVWTDTNKISVGNKWGIAPVLAEVVPFTLTLPVGTNNVRVWSLNERGQRKEALPVTGDAASTTIQVDAGAASLWYELQVSRWTTSFQQWRWNNFDETALTDESVSGPSALSAGNTPNLIKYHLGAPANEPIPTQRLPQGSLLSVSNQIHMAIGYVRDSLAKDVLVTAEVSPDLTSWYSGSDQTVTLPVEPLGEFERVTIRSVHSIHQSPWRYMRLRFEQM